jgi:hypothetical protein
MGCKARNSADEEGTNPAPDAPALAHSAQVTPEIFVEPSVTLAGYSSCVVPTWRLGWPLPSSPPWPQRQGPISADMQFPHIQMTQSFHGFLA